MLSLARKLAPRLDAAVLQLLACLAFLACLVAPVQAGSTAPIGSDAVRAHASDAASLDRLHIDAAPADDLRATEPEGSEEDAAPEALALCFTPALAALPRFVRAPQRLTRALPWRTQPARSVVMAQGPP